MIGVSAEPARLVIEALRMDQWSWAEVETRSHRALELGVGGFLLFGGDSDAVAELTARLRREAGRPLWIAADLERGAGQQFRGLSELPPPAALATLDDAATAAWDAGRLTAEEALAVGVNWILAPVLDLDAESANPIVSTRSFGADPDLVRRLGRAWIEGCQSTGAAACAKHFPGHGRTRDDSHIGLPVVTASALDLEADLAPFSSVVDRVCTIMVAHVAFPALGSDRAATRAPEVVSSLLRERLGFRGPVATDAMIMGAIRDDATAAVDAVRAGIDLILYPSDAAATIAALSEAGTDRRLADRIARACRTSEAALRSLAGGHAEPSPCTEDGSRASGTLRELELACRTIVDASEGLSSWSPRSPTRVVPVSDDPEVGPPAGRAGPLGTILADDLREAGWGIVPESDEAQQCLVVLAATPRGWKGHGGPSGDVIQRARASLRNAERGLIVLLGHARWLEVLEAPGICAWSTETLMERAAALWLRRAVT